MRNASKKTKVNPEEKNINIISLYILSPYVSIEDVLEYVECHEKSIFLCTFVLLDSERLLILDKNPNSEIILFSDLFNDFELNSIDNTIENEIEQIIAQSKAEMLVKLVYSSLYMKAVRYHRNFQAALKLSCLSNSIKKIHYCVGPNIDIDAWYLVFPNSNFIELYHDIRENNKKFSNVNICPLFLKTEDNVNKIYYMTPTIKDLSRTRLVDNLLNNSNLIDISTAIKSFSFFKLKSLYLFLVSVPLIFKVMNSQLLLMIYLIKSKQISPIYKKELFSLTSIKSFLHILHKLIIFLSLKSKYNVRALISGIHSFSSIFALIAKLVDIPVFVLQDCYLPINYPRSIYGIFDKYTFIWWNDNSKNWGKHIGLHGFVCAPTIISKTKSDIIKYNNINNSVSKKILVLLNHGGEWTSLIFRTDIDLFVMDILISAKKRPQYTFCIRFHPTTNLESHDGINCTKRLKRLIVESNTSNVFVSKNSFEADASQSDFAISEYSLTLFEFVLINSGGVASYNPTKRRNFFEEFTSQGLPYATTPDELLKILDMTPIHGRDILLSNYKSQMSNIENIINWRIPSSSG